MTNDDKPKRRWLLKRIMLSGIILGTSSFCTFGQLVKGLDAKQIGSANDFSFAFITDIHISPNLDNLRDEELPQQRNRLTDVSFIGFETALSEIKKHNVDFVLTGGDNINTESYYLPPVEGKLPVSVSGEEMTACTKRMHKISSNIGMPVYYANGNHDVYSFPPVTREDSHFGSRFFAKHLGYQGKHYYSFDKNGWHFIVLNTYDGNGTKMLFTDKQIEWLKNDLKNMKVGTPVVVTGHTPFPINDKDAEQSESIYRILKNYNVRLMLFGHLHAYHEFMWHDIPCVIGSSLSGAVWSLVRNVHDVDLGRINKGTDQGYLIVSVTDGVISWKHYPFSYSIEKYYYQETGKRPFAKYQITN
uniref:metallophosphoesterase family protein n=1 Tax=uncultured Draconibacterium sp. TaxID=1573823 RepID=UPI00321697B0